MTKVVGVIWVGHNCAEYLNGPHGCSLRPWMEAKQQRLGGHEWKICAVSVPFQGFDQQPPDGTWEILRAKHAERFVDHLVTSDYPITEVVARQQALKVLMEMGCDTILQADADEFPATDQIERIMGFVGKSLAPCFKLSLRNYIFDTHTYLVEPFTPMRIHRVTFPGGWRAAGFWDDNNVQYVNRDGGVKRDVDFACVTVPKTVAWISHITWISNERSRKKSEYQQLRWGRCDYRWDDTAGRLVWNISPEPETATDSC